MVFKKKAAVLSALVAILALVYILTFVFDPQRQQSRQAFSWLDPGLLSKVDRIEINGSGGGSPGGRTVLIRKNNIWVFEAEVAGLPEGNLVQPLANNQAQAEFPVKQGRVEDFLAVLTRRDIYPLRAVSDAGREKLGVVEGTASRIVVRGGAGLPLLDLLVGGSDALGQGVYLRRAGSNEIYSGEDHFTLYTESKPNAWYELRLFPSDTQAVPVSRGNGNTGPLRAALTVESIQQAEVTLPESEEGGGAVQPQSFTIRRQRTEGGGGGWGIVGSESVLDTTKVEAWLRSILEAEGEDFSAGSPASIKGSITLRFGDGTSRIVKIGPMETQDTEKRRSAVVSESSLVYILPEWTVNRLFREAASFLKTN